MKLTDHMELIDDRFELVGVYASLDELLVVLDFNAEQYGPASIRDLTLFLGDGDLPSHWLDGDALLNVWGTRLLPSEQEMTERWRCAA